MWSLAITLYTTFILIGYIPSLMRYDKQFNQKVEAATSSEAHHGFLMKYMILKITSATVPKSYFTHFYIVSSTVGSGVVGYCYRNEYPCLLALMLWVHSMRRLVECYCIHRFSSSRMTIIVYLGGIGYYLVCNCSVLVASLSNSVVRLSSSCTGLCFFCFGSLLQFYVHQQLASLRKPTDDARYHIPQSWVFTIVTSPHYVAEILVYAGVAVIGKYHRLLLLNLLWVIINLACTAKKNHEWYVEHSHVAYGALVPGVW